MTQSRPLRAITAVIGGWVAVRTLFLLPPSPVMTAASPIARAFAEPPPGVTIALPDETRAASVSPAAAALTIVLEAPQSLSPEPRRSPFRLVALSPQVEPGDAPAPEAAISVAPRPLESERRSRLSGSVWALVRDGGVVPVGAGGQLGGSQAGVRLFYEPGPRGWVLTARASAPLEGRRGRELSVGAGYRGRIGGVLLERRIALDRGARDAFALTGYAGLYDLALTPRLRANAHLQAGVVGLKSRDVFADGAASLERTVLESGTARLAVGATAIAAAQPGTRRVDIGPLVTARLPVAKNPVRITAGWRHRIAGNAAPRSGPAVTLGFDF